MSVARMIALAFVSTPPADSSFFDPLLTHFAAGFWCVCLQPILEVFGTPRPIRMDPSGCGPAPEEAREIKPAPRKTGGLLRRGRLRVYAGARERARGNG